MNAFADEPPKCYELGVRLQKLGKAGDDHLNKLLNRLGTDGVLPVAAAIAAAVLLTVPAAAQAPATKAANAPKVAAAGKGNAEVTALRKRIEQLEGQLVDLQVVIGTLESLARSGAANAAAAPRVSSMNGADSARIDALETQVQAITSQLDQISNQLRTNGPAPSVGTGRPATGPRSGVQFGEPGAKVSTFGSTTVNADTGDPIGGLIKDSGVGPVPPPVASAPLPEATVAAVNPSAAGESPKQLYEAAYGHLLRQDYGAAQAGFTAFLRKYPKDALSADALYWLGETHYVQRNYSDAAEAFDLVTAAYSKSAKAPEAQLKRAMALSQLGKRKEACNTLRQMNRKFPNARQTVKSKAAGERQRIGCS